MKNVFAWTIAVCTATVGALRAQEGTYILHPLQGLIPVGGETSIPVPKNVNKTNIGPDTLRFDDHWLATDLDCFAYLPTQLSIGYLGGPLYNMQPVFGVPSYVSEQGLGMPIPQRPCYQAQMLGMYVWFLNGNDVVGTPDNFQLRVYDYPSYPAVGGGVGLGALLGTKTFQLDPFNYEPNDPFGAGNYIPMNGPVNLTEKVFIGITTSGPTINDTIAFAWTAPDAAGVDCGEDYWYFRLTRTSDGAVFGPFRMQQVFVADIGNPMFFPVIRYVYNGPQSATVNINPGPATGVCRGESVSLTASVQESGEYTYTWSPAAGLSATTGATVVASPTQTTFYTVNVSQGTNNCLGTAVVRVDVLDKPEVTVLTTQATDAANIGSIKATVYGGAPPYTYALNGGAPQAGNLFTGLATGNYTLAVTDANGCSVNKTVVVESTSDAVMQTFFDHLVNVEDDCNLYLPTPLNGPNGFIGYLGGPIFDMSGILTGPPSYVRHQGVVIPVPARDCYEAKFRGMYIWFAPGTEVVGAPDDFELSAFQFNQPASPGVPATVTLLGSSNFQLPSTVGTPNPFAGTNFIPFEGDVTVADSVVFAVKTSGEVDDTLTFYWSAIEEGENYNCGPDQWYLMIRYTGFPQIAPALPLQNYLAGDVGSPMMFPMLEYVPISEVEVTPSQSLVVGCSGYSVELSATATGAGPYTYTWVAPNGAVIATGQNVSFIPQTTGVYSVFADDGSSSCPDGAAEIVVSVVQSPSVADVQVQNATSGNNGAITVTGAGGTEPYTYLLNGMEQTSGAFSGLAPGVYIVAVRDVNGCESQAVSAEVFDQTGYDVWPGDANNDGTVTVGDYFLTAGAYGKTGPARNAQGTLWQAYLATQLWATESNFQGVIVNDMYLDANGDGTINLFDVAVTVVHRGLSR
jgi:hypothetical protein